MAGIPGYMGASSSTFGTASEAGSGSVGGTASGGGLGMGAGSVIGAAVGAGVSLVDSNEKSKDEEERAKKAKYGGSIPKYRGMFDALMRQKEAQQRKMAGMGMLAQAAFDWASSIR